MAYQKKRAKETKNRDLLAVFGCKSLFELIS